MNAPDPTIPGLVMMPGNPPTPCPMVLTEAELIRFLRLDETGVGDPTRTIRYYRDNGLLIATQIGRQLRYSLPNVLKFLDLLARRNVR